MCVYNSGRQRHLSNSENEQNDTKNQSSAESYWTQSTRPIPQSERCDRAHDRDGTNHSTIIVTGSSDYTIFVWNVCLSVGLTLCSVFLKTDNRCSIVEFYFHLHFFYFIFYVNVL